MAKTMNRRMVLAAAAGAAALPAGAATGPSETKVVIDLGGISLPTDVAHVMQTDLRRAVLSAVARAFPRTRFKSLPLPDGALGIILRPA